MHRSVSHQTSAAPEPPAAADSTRTPTPPFAGAKKSRSSALPPAWWMTKAAAEPPHESAPASSAVADAPTEPVEVYGAAQLSSESAAPTADAAISGPLAPVTQLTTAVHSGIPSAAARDTRKDTANDASIDKDLLAEQGPLKPSSARARLRAATRARRAYERAEVRRFTRHLRKRRAAWIGGVAAVLALGLFVAVGTFSPLMALSTITVEGANRLDPAVVSAALSGQIGTPLPLVDLTEVKSDLSQFSMIQSFSTESRPPNTLVVRIVERDPIGAIAGANGFDLVDPAGVVIQTTPERPEGYPIAEVTGADGLAAAGSVVQALPADIRAQLDVVRAASTDDVSLVLADGTSVAWGSAEQSSLKALTLTTLMAAAPPGTVSVYDVSSPASPVVR